MEYFNGFVDFFTNKIGILTLFYKYSYNLPISPVTKSGIVHKFSGDGQNISTKHHIIYAANTFVLSEYVTPERADGAQFNDESKRFRI